MATKKVAAKKVAKPGKPAVKKPAPAAKATIEKPKKPVAVKKTAGDEGITIEVGTKSVRVVEPKATKKSAVKKAVVKPAVKKAAPVKKVAKVDKLMKTTPVPLTPAQKSLASVATAALKIRQQQITDSVSRSSTAPAAPAREETPAPRFERPAPPPVESGLSFKDRLRQADRQHAGGHQAFLNRLQAAQRNS